MSEKRKRRQGILIWDHGEVINWEGDGGLSQVLADLSIKLGRGPDRKIFNNKETKE